MAKKDKTDKPTVTTRTPTKQMRRRALVAVILVVGLFFSANIVKLVQLQVLESADWQKRAVSQQLSDTVVTAKRGIIYDSDMQPLLAEIAERLMQAYRDPRTAVTELQQQVFFSRVLQTRRAIRLGAGEASEVKAVHEQGFDRYVLLSEAIENLCMRKKETR